MNNQDTSPIHLAVDNSARNSALNRFAHLSDDIWSHTTREEAIKERPYLLLDSVRFEGIPKVSFETLAQVHKYLRRGSSETPIPEELATVERRAQLIKSTILECLRDKERANPFITSSISGEEFEPIREHLLSIQIALSVRSGETGMISPEGQNVVQENIRKAYDAIARIIRSKVGKFQTREEIESYLKWKGIDIHNETVTKLMLFEINQGRTDPEVLILPAYHPFNPLVCAVEYDQVFRELRSALSLFAFVDELP